MTMLDDRARQAVDAIDRSVADYRPPAAGFAAAQRRHAMWAGAGWALAGSAAAAAVVVTAMFSPSPDPDVATTLPETVVTTEAPVTETTVKPSPEPEALPPAVVESTTTQAPVTTEAPTTTLDATPPELAITTPAEGARFEENVVTFSGVTEPGATVVAGGKWDAPVNEQGGWSIQLVLSAGANGASFVATDAAGNQSSARITVYYDPPAPPTTEPPGEEVGFTANATYGSCELDPPYDVYYGTADPETKVTISSAFGSGSVYADGSGNWSKQVFFPEAPYGETFVVTVKDHTGKKKQFEFVSLAGA